MLDAGPTVATRRVPARLATRTFEDRADAVVSGVSDDDVAGLVDGHVLQPVELSVPLAVLSKLGAEIIELTMPDVTPVESAWWELSTAEAAAFHADTFPSRAQDFGPGFREVLEHGAAVSGITYAEAAKFRAELSGQIGRVLAQVDCLVCPSMSNAASPKLANSDVDEEGGCGTLRFR